MRRLIMLGVVGVVAVVAGGVVLRSRQHASATTQTQIQVGDVNNDGYINFTGDVIPLAKMSFGLLPAPAPIVLLTDAHGNLAVAEQNLDAGGNIKVHEQGTVNVSVVSQTTQGRVIPIVTGATVLQGQAQIVLGSFVNVSDCSHIDAYISATVNNVSGGGGWLYPYLEQSPDGATGFQPFTGMSEPPYFGANLTDADNGITKSYQGRFLWNSWYATANQTSQYAASPYVRLRLTANLLTADATNISAQLYCAPK